MKDDRTTNVEELKDIVRDFVDRRDWAQFHSPKNLSMSISIEAAELMEHFQWLTTEGSFQLKKDPKAMKEVGEELSDILSYCFNLANVLDIDITSTFKEKVQKNCKKYPVDKAKGKSTKYNKL